MPRTAYTLTAGSPEGGRRRSTHRLWLGLRGLIRGAPASSTHHGRLRWGTRTLNRKTNATRTTRATSRACLAVSTNGSARDSIVPWPTRRDRGWGAASSGGARTSPGLCERAPGGRLGRLRGRDLADVTGTKGIKNLSGVP
jgi:hypothetical protein